MVERKESYETVSSEAVSSAAVSSAAVSLTPAEVSVVIPTLNAEKYLDRLIPAVLGRSRWHR